MARRETQEPTDKTHTSDRNGQAGTAGKSSLLTPDDFHLFNEGTHHRLYQKLGAHPGTQGNQSGVHFAVWAPGADRVSVIGDFNDWRDDACPMKVEGSSGIWSAFVAGSHQGGRYKYRIFSSHNGYVVDKADPFAFRAEEPPRTGSVVWDLAYDWSDGEWMTSRGRANALDAPISTYEVHLGSWMRVHEEGNRYLTYREIASKLAEYVQQTGYTHVELLPVMEHPFYGSWGYQTSGYFAPSSRYGTPQDFMYFVDTLHQAGIGVILDWVPSHFPSDEHGLSYFDGTHLFEHADRRQGHHPDWDSLIFNYGRHEVRSFLISSALYWLDRYHIDGLRVDAVASMLYLDYSRKAGEWIPNKHGGRENLEAMSFLRQFNEAVYANYPDVQTIAEESTAWPMVSRPTYVGGLGFGLKWDMGWMHDTLDYMSRAPVHRKFHHGTLTFRMIYAFTENFMLPLSHDEVVHGKGSLLGKMPGDEWQKFANLRLLFGYMFGQPAKKLNFMGGEIGQESEWYHEASLDWHLLERPANQGLLRWVSDINRLYRNEPALYELDCDSAGFEWVDANDSEQSLLSFIRKPASSDDQILAVYNFTPVPRHNYIVGVPSGGFWRELINSDAADYGGSGQGNMGGAESNPVPAHGRPNSLTITVPPLGAVFFKRDGGR
ncbi:MAG: 1,4-alpha-glucan branching protein GlgB [Dehalococcoidia bacterium]